MFPSLEWATTQGSLQWRVHIILHSLQIQQYAGHTINQYKLMFPFLTLMHHDSMNRENFKYC